MQNGVVLRTAEVSTVFEMSIPTIFYHPRMDKSGNYYVCSQMGEIITFRDDEIKGNDDEDKPTKIFIYSSQYK